MSPRIPTPAALLQRRPWLTACLLGLAAFVVFLPAVAGGFVDWDDDRYVFANPLVLGGLSPAGVRDACTRVVFFNWAPLTILSYQLDTTLFGTAPWGFHLTNVLLHAVSTGLLYLVLFRMTGRAGRSAAATLLFTLHPLRVESVAWIAERKDVLSVCLFMLALLAYERYCRRPAVGRYLLVVAAMLASLLAKATLVTLPVLLLLLDIWPLGRLAVPGLGRPTRPDGEPSPYPPRPWPVILLEKLPLFVLGFLFSRIALFAQGDAVATEISSSFLRARLPNAITAVGWYLGTSLVPLGLHPACVHTGSDVAWTRVAVAAAAVAAVVGLAFAAGRRTPSTACGLAWFLASLLPVLGLVQVGFQAHADRFTYVPHVGLAVAVVWGVADLCDRMRLPRWTGPAILGAACLGSIALTERQIAVWRTSEALWQHVLAVDPGNPVALGKTAVTLAETGRLDRAAELYREALTRAEYPWLIVGLARVHHARGDEDQMRRYRDWAARIAPHEEAVVELLEELPPEPTSRPQPVVDPRVRDLLALGSVDLNSGRLGAALTAFHAAIEVDPACAAAHNLAGIACIGLDRHGEAAARFRTALGLEPGNFGFHVNLARVLAVIQDWPGCLVACEQGILLRPGDPELTNLLEKARQKTAAAPAGR